MTAFVSGDCVLTAIEKREVAVVAAKRFLASVAVEDIPNLSDDQLRDRLRKCRGLLKAVVALSSSQAPLVRTVDEAAAALRVRAATVYRLVNDGDLPAYRLAGRRIRIDNAALRGYLAHQRVGPGGITPHDIPAEHFQPGWE